MALLIYLPSYITCRKLLSRNERSWHCISKITSVWRRAEYL